MPKVEYDTYHINPKYWDRQTWSNNVDPDQMPQNAWSGLFCLPFFRQFLNTSVGAGSQIDLLKF